MKKWLSLALVALLAFGAMPALAGGAAPAELPREECLVYNGLQWGAPANYNPFAMSGAGFPMSENRRFLLYEALYMYNMLTNENEPLLADGPITWEDNLNFVVKIKPQAHFSDGEKLTADDVVWTFNIANEKNGGFFTVWSDCWSYLEKVEKVDDYTVRFTLVAEPVNVHFGPAFLGVTRILPQHIWEPKIKDEFGGDVDKLRAYFGEESPVGSGPYKITFFDETRIICTRDDNYWGQAPEMFGKLAAPKYVVHPIFQDNAAGNLAFSEGKVDVSQQFLPNVWELQEKMDAPVKTYLSEAPYHLGAGIPSLVFNMQKDGLKDPVIHKAIALSLDYEAININAMSKYSQPLVYSFVNAYLFGDYIDMEDEEVKALMWDTTKLDENIEAANKLLDEAGYKDVDGDGMREMPDGSKIEWKAECPAGWSDWNMSLEILCESAKKVGLNVITYFPEMNEYFLHFYAGNSDIGMWNPFANSLSVAMPWEAAFKAFYSKNVPPVGEQGTHNFGRYANSEMDDLIDKAAATNNIDELRDYYTEINKIWLRDLPTVPLMYRPEVFHTVYEKYWTGFAQKDDGTNTPPMICMDAAGIKDLYNLKPTGAK